jgi:hypothetical protein
MSKKRGRQVKYIDTVLFDAAMDHILVKNRDKYGELLVEKDKWGANADFRQRMQQVSEMLALRLMHRASLFAMHRTDTKPDSMKKAKVILTVEDVKMAWDTLNMDAQY